MLQQFPLLPQILKKRLVFGDPEQITAFQKYEAEVDEFLGDGIPKEYRVQIEFQYFTTIITVMARSPREARAKAEAKAEREFDDEDYDIIFVTEKAH